MVRFTELSAARRGARRKLAAANQGATRASILATVIGIDPEDGSRLLVSVDPADPDLSVLAGPTKVVPGALVHVEIDSAGRPIRVLGPASTRPEGLDEDAPAPAPIVPMEGLAPRELTPEEAQAIQDTADGLDQAQQDIAQATQEAQVKFGELEAADAANADAISGAVGRLGTAEGLISANATAISSAQDAAASALSAAQSAAEDALTAAGIAEGKGQVIAQISAPSGSRARAENLWVRLPDYKVHVFVGGGWVPATDPDLVAAAQVAAEAKTAAEDAQAALDSLVLSVDGPGGLKDRLETAEQDLSDKAESSDLEALDQILQGPDTLPEVVADKFWSGLTVTDRLQAIAGWVGGVMLEDDSVTADKIVATSELITKLFATRWATVAEQLVVQGRLIADHADVINAAMRNLSVSEKADFVTAFAQELYGDEFVFRAGTLARLTVAKRNIYLYRDEFLTDLPHSEVRPIGGRSNAPSVAIPAGTGSRYLYDSAPGSGIPRTPVTPGEQYRISAWVTPNAETLSNNLQVYYRWVSADETQWDQGSFRVVGETAPAWQWYQIEGVTGPAPAWAATLSIGWFVGNGHTGTAVFSHTTVESMTDGNLIVDGGVKARHLGVVPEEGTGGMELLPPGLRIIPAGEEAGTAVSLRVDEPNWLSFAQDGVTTFSVSPEGGVVAQDIAANSGLQYRGVELEERLSEPARGIIAHARNVENADPGTDSARLLSVTFRTPAEDRKVRVTIRAHGGTSAPRAYFHLRQAEGNSVTNTNSLQAEYYTPALPASSSLSVNWEHERTVSEWGWPYDATITLGVFVRSMDAGKTLNFAAHNHQEILVHDTGPAVRAVLHRPYIPSTGGGTGGGTETQPGTREYTQTFTPTWSQSYLGSGGRYNYGPGRLYHGQYLSGNGILRSLAGFNRTAIQNFCSGAEMVRARVQLTVAHTYSSSGADFRFGYTANTSAPTTWTGSMTHFRDAHFTPGQYRSLLADNAMTAMKAGTFGALALSPGSDSSMFRYGYVNASSVKLVITVRK